MVRIHAFGTVFGQVPFGFWSGSMRLERKGLCQYFHGSDVWEQLPAAGCKPQLSYQYSQIIWMIGHETTSARGHGPTAWVKQKIVCLEWFVCCAWNSGGAASVDCESMQALEAAQNPHLTAQEMTATQLHDPQQTHASDGLKRSHQNSCKSPITRQLEIVSLKLLNLKLLQPLYADCKNTTGTIGYQPAND